MMGTRGVGVPVNTSDLFYFLILLYLFVILKILYYLLSWLCWIFVATHRALIAAY